MPPVVTTFRPTSRIKSGKDGLSTTANTKSHVAIKGENLANGLAVKVYDPPESTTPRWSGTTSGTNGQGTACHAKVDYVGTATPSPRMPRDGDTNVGVTVGDSNPKNFNVQTGPVLDGGYIVQCIRPEAAQVDC